MRQNKNIVTKPAVGTKSPNQNGANKAKRPVSASPGKVFKPKFTQATSAKEDIVDPIYKNDDPINASMKERKSEGAITSVILKAGVPAFFYEMKLKGPGCKVKGDDKKTPNTRKSQNRAADSSNKKSSSKKDMASHPS